MQRSTDRILTTHVGSLPRPADLQQTLQLKDRGEPYDEAAFEARVRDAVGEAVRKQVEVGIDIVADGELSKSSFTNYVKDRLSGLEAVNPDRTPVRRRCFLSTRVPAQPHPPGSPAARDSACVRSTLNRSDGRISQKSSATFQTYKSRSTAWSTSKRSCRRWRSARCCS